MRRPIAIVAAMRSELGPLLRGKTSRRIEGIDLYDLGSAAVAIAGVGRAAGQRAAQIVIRETDPAILVSAGLCGALRPELKAGEVVQIGTVIDEADGSRYVTEAGGHVLVTASAVAGEPAKLRLAQRFQAAVVDMEGAAVAQAAERHGLRFFALKAVSDELSFTMPPVNQFVNDSGQFRVGAFALHVALRPRWWKPVLQLARNAGLGSRNLSAALQHLIEQYSNTNQGERVSLA